MAPYIYYPCVARGAHKTSLRAHIYLFFVCSAWHIRYLTTPESIPQAMNKILLSLVFCCLVAACSNGKEASDPQAVASPFYFFARDVSRTYGLWKTDGTTEGTELIKDSFYASPVIVPHQNLAYFAAQDPAQLVGIELWKSDGTVAGTQLVKDINPAGSGMGEFGGTSLGENILFFANDGTHGVQLWKSNGTESGTQPLSNWSTTDANGSPTLTKRTLSDFATVADSVYFAADDGVHGLELWKSNGAERDTVMVADIFTGPQGSHPINLSGVGDRLYFFTSYSAVGSGGLWVSDGTAAGTQMLSDVSPSNGLGPRPFVEVNGVVIFGAMESLAGTELWRTDGTPGGTVLLADINPGWSSSDPEFFTVLNNAAYFVAYDDVHGEALWKTDGTTSGTALLKDMNPNVATGGKTIIHLTTFNNFVYFRVALDTGYELWRSDGTESGTVFVKRVALFDDPRVVGNKLLFPAADVAHGTEMWVSDGSEEGTSILKDICPGSCDAFP